MTNDSSDQTAFRLMRVGVQKLTGPDVPEDRRTVGILSALSTAMSMSNPVFRKLAIQFLQAKLQ